MAKDSPKINVNALWYASSKKSCFTLTDYIFLVHSPYPGKRK